MTVQDVEEIFDKVKSELDGNDNVFQGVMILLRYANNEIVITAAEHDTIYSIDVQEAIDNGITKKEITKLAKLNWMIECESFACFV